MSKMKYNYSCQESATEIYFFSWEIKNFENALNNKYGKSYHTKKNILDPYPQLKIRTPTQNNDSLVMSCLWPTMVKIKADIWAGQKNLYRSDQYIRMSLRESTLCSFLKSNMVNNKTQYFDLVNGTATEDITFHIKFTVANDHTRPEVQKKRNQLNIYLEKIFETGDFSDAIMKSEDGEEYKVHKVILGFKSDVLKANFEHNTTECQTNAVNAPFESEIVEEILSFIYKGVVPRIKEIPEQILAAADYYQIIELKRLCGRELCKKLSVENVLKMLELAKLYHEDYLEESALDFIKYGNITSIMETESWNDISVDSLKSIYEHIHSQADDVVYCDIIYDPLLKAE